MKTKSSVFSETEEEKESVSSNINDTKKKEGSKQVLSFPIPQDVKKLSEKDLNQKSLVSYN